MTKKELLESIANFPDTADVFVVIEGPNMAAVIDSIVTNGDGESMEEILLVPHYRLRTVDRKKDDMEEPLNS